MKKRVKIISEIAQGFEGNFKTADLLLDSSKTVSEKKFRERKYLNI